MFSRVEIMVTGGIAPVTGEAMERFPALRLIVAIASGHDGIDLQAARARGITVTSSIGVNAPDVADLALGTFLCLVRRISADDRLLRAGGWFPRRAVQARSIGTMRAGILGLGSIGREVAMRLQAFGCQIGWWGPNPKESSPWLRSNSLTALFEASDVVFVCAHYSADTHHIVNAELLAKLGARGYLVNVSRGGLIDEDALIAALCEGTIAGAALDVFADEPTPAERWREVPNTVLTPHLGGITDAAMTRVMARARESVRRGLAGEDPEMIVS
jgi:hydroxypyruvate reductase